MLRHTKQTETNRIEYKEKLTDDLEKEVVAFLNSRGGDIHIGIKDDGTVVGVAKPDDVQLKIKDRLKDNIRPSIMGLFDIVMEEQDGKTVITVNVASGAETPCYTKQKGRSEAGCFIRVGSSSQPVAEEMIEKLLEKRCQPSLVHMPSHRQDLIFTQLQISHAGFGLKLNENFAKSLNFLTSDEKYNMLAYMFADNNRVSIRVAKWWGADKSNLRENEEYGDCSLVKAIQKVLDKFGVCPLPIYSNSKKAGILGIIFTLRFITLTSYRCVVKSG